MLRLNLSRDPQWIELSHGVKVLALPLTSAVLISLRGDLSLEDAALLPPAEQSLRFAKAVASRVITEWEGVGDEDGKELPVTSAATAALMDLFPLYRAFEANYLVPWLNLDAEKNASAPSPNGTSAEALDIAVPVTKCVPIVHQDKMRR